jgi:hypothetical protein
VHTDMSREFHPEHVRSSVVYVVRESRYYTYVNNTNNGLAYMLKSLPFLGRMKKEGTAKRHAEYMSVTSILCAIYVLPSTYISPSDFLRVRWFCLNVLFRV